jgi:hypothetical protein
MPIRSHVEQVKLRATLGLLLLLSGRSNCLAHQIHLPEVGTIINYDFLAQAPIFVLATEAPSSIVIKSEATFADGDHLGVISGSTIDYMGVHLTLRAPGIADLFNPLFISFDETLALVNQDGMVSHSAENTGIGYYVDDRAQYTFSWDFWNVSLPHLEGFKWNITPDLLPGNDLPKLLTIDAYIWGSDWLYVVPEPCSLQLGIIVAIGVVMIRRRVQRSRLYSATLPPP